MSDDQLDPWKSLAAELGVDASKEPTAPPPSSPPAPSAPRQSAPEYSPPPKKMSSDWMALAGELGIEVPPEPKVIPAKRDPVAELLGFPPPSERAPYGNEERGRDDDSEGREKRFRDDDLPHDRWTSDAQEYGREPESDDIKRLEAVGDTEEPAGQERDVKRRPPQRRRGRRGGRDRGEPREGRSKTLGHRDSVGRGEARSESSRPRYERDTNEVPPKDAEQSGLKDSENLDVGSDERIDRADGDSEPQQKRRRRRGRRGRGGARERLEGRPERPSAHSRPDQIGDTPMPTEIGTESEEIDFVELPSHESDSLEPSGVSPASAIHDNNGDDELGAPGESHAGKNSVRDIMTWKAAIGMII